MFKLKLIFRDLGRGTDESFFSLSLQCCRKLLGTDSGAPETSREQWEAAGQVVY